MADIGDPAVTIFQQLRKQWAEQDRKYREEKLNSDIECQTTKDGILASYRQKVEQLEKNEIAQIEKLRSLPKQIADLKSEEEILIKSLRSIRAQLLSLSSPHANIEQQVKKLRESVALQKAEAETSLRQLQSQLLINTHAKVAQLEKFRQKELKDRETETTRLLYTPLPQFSTLNFTKFPAEGLISTDISTKSSQPQDGQLQAIKIFAPSTALSCRIASANISKNEPSASNTANTAPLVQILDRQDKSSESNSNDSLRVRSTGSNLMPQSTTSVPSVRLTSITSQTNNSIYTGARKPDQSPATTGSSRPSEDVLIRLKITGKLNGMTERGTNMVKDQETVVEFPFGSEKFYVIKCVVCGKDDFRMKKPVEGLSTHIREEHSSVFNMISSHELTVRACGVCTWNADRVWFERRPKIQYPSLSASTHIATPSNSAQSLQNTRVHQELGSLHNKVAPRLRGNTERREKIKFQVRDGFYVSPWELEGVPLAKISQQSEYWSTSWITKEQCIAYKASDSKQVRRRIEYLDAWPIHINQLFQKDCIGDKGLMDQKSISGFYRALEVLKTAKENGVIKASPISWLRRCYISEAQFRQGEGRAPGTLKQFLANISSNAKFCKLVKDGGLSPDYCDSDDTEDDFGWFPANSSTQTDSASTLIDIETHAKLPLVRDAAEDRKYDPTDQTDETKANIKKPPSFCPALIIQKRTATGVKSLRNLRSPKRRRIYQMEFETPDNNLEKSWNPVERSA